MAAWNISLTRITIHIQMDVEEHSAIHAPALRHAVPFFLHYNAASKYQDLR